MAVDLALYRRVVRVSSQPLVRLSVIDIAPDHPQRTIVFLHGFGGQARQWQYQLHEFSFSNRVIALDLRGHGLSDKPAGDYSMAQIQSDLKAALEQLKVSESIVLVGHSFGGAVAVEYAASHPERVELLVLIAATGEYKLNPLYRFLLNLPLEILRLAKPFVRNWLGASPAVLHAWYHQNLTRWNGWSLLRGLTMPTIVIRGHLDVVLSRPSFEEVARAVLSADEVDVGASGHLVMLERREAVNRAIQRGLDRARRSWREDQSDAEISARANLLQERPWLSHYDEGVPYTVAIPNVPLPSLLQSAAHRFPLRPALIFEGNRITYRRLNQEVNRFANALLSLGLQKGDRVMLLLPNLPQLVIAFYGVLEAGGVAVFSPAYNDSDEFTRQVRETGARILVTQPRFSDLVQKVRVGLSIEGYSPVEKVILAQYSEYLPWFARLALRFSGTKPVPPPAGELGEGIYRFTDLLYSHSWQSPEINLPAENLAAIVFTGGTVSTPKGVMLSHRNLVANALQTRHWMPAAHEGRERFLSLLPFSHSYGLTAALNVPVSLGAALILQAGFNPRDPVKVEAALKAIKRYKPTIFPAIPQMYVAIMDFHGVRKYGVQSIEACISGASPLPVEVQEAFEKLTRGRLVEGYGLTEASPVTHANPLRGQQKIGSIGIPLPTTQARVVDLRQGRVKVKVGKIGELAIRGPQVMMGYWRDPEATRQAFNPDGWLLTGDIAQVDREGYFRIIARKAELWYPEKGDKPAFPRDVEEVLYEVPQIKEVAVVGIANKPVAFVIARKDHPPAETLIDYCRRRLPPELVPRLVIFLDDFPRTFIGKVLRRELASMVERSKQ